MSTSNKPILMSNKTTIRQYKLMLKFMQRHGDLCAPSGGGEGKLKTKRLWEELTSKLNAVSQGYPKKLQKWIKIWSDWKARTKSKALSIRTEENNTSLVLTELECELMVFLGWQVIVVGNKDDNSDKAQPEVVNPISLEVDMSHGDHNYDSHVSPSQHDLGTEVMEDSDHVNTRNASDPLSPPSCAVIQTAKQTPSNKVNKKHKNSHKRRPDSESRMEVIMEKYADIEAKRLEVELLKEKNEERRLAALEQSNNNQRQYMEFMGYLKGAMDSFLATYSAKNS